MVEHVVFFLEEPSAQEFLRVLVPPLLPANVTAHFLVFEGKQDLEKRLVGRMRGWLRPNSCFVVMRDQDSGDCVAIKSRLAQLCRDAGQPDALVRIACRELETFFVGDWQAIADAYEKPALARHAGSAKFREPDQLESPSHELKKLVPLFQKRDGARRISAHLDPQRNRSKSFNALFRGLERICRT